MKIIKYFFELLTIIGLYLYGCDIHELAYSRVDGIQLFIPQLMTRYQKFLIMMSQNSMADTIPKFFTRDFRACTLIDYSHFTKIELDPEFDMRCLEYIHTQNPNIFIKYTQEIKDLARRGINWNSQMINIVPVSNVCNTGFIVYDKKYYLCSIEDILKMDPEYCSKLKEFEQSKKIDNITSVQCQS